MLKVEALSGPLQTDRKTDRETEGWGSPNQTWQYMDRKQDTGVSERQALSFKRMRVVFQVNTVTEGSSEPSSRFRLKINNP